MGKIFSPYFDEKTIKQAASNYVPTQCQNIAPSMDISPDQSHAFTTKRPIMPFFLDRKFDFKDGQTNYYMILADVGMGKTTFILNLFSQLSKVMKGNDFNLALVYSGHAATLSEIDKIPLEERKKTILLWDALDEDYRIWSNYKSRIKKILKSTEGFAEVIMTCRTHFFTQEEENRHELGVLTIHNGEEIYRFRKIYISPFDSIDINKYINKKYPFYSIQRKKTARKIVQKAPNLMVRPMLLKNLDYLIEEQPNYQYMFLIYEQLLKAWIMREAKKRSLESEGTVFFEDMYKFVRLIALDMYRNHKKRSGFFISENELEDLALKHQIRISIPFLKIGALLNRTAKGKFSFSHQSVLEYILALIFFEKPSLMDKLSVVVLKIMDNFLEEMHLAQVDGLSGKYRTLHETNYFSLKNLQLNDRVFVSDVNLEEVPSDFSILRAFPRLRSLWIGNDFIEGDMLLSLIRGEISWAEVKNLSLVKV